MIPVTPVVIPEPFAENGTKNTIPDQSPGGTEPNASWNTGFPPITMINRQAGGKPPLGADFNGILNALSQHAFFTQSGCIFPWRGSEDDFPGLNYLVGAHVLGADMKEYIAVQPSGPDIPASGGGYVGPRDPTTDNDRTWWTPAVTGGDLPEFDGTTIKLINGKYGVPEFTVPTANAPGKAGLVPGPHAITSNLQPLRVLSANAQFNTMTFGSFDISWERSDSTNLVLGAQNCANGTNLEDLLVAGDYYASQWTNAPAEGEGVYSLREMPSYGDPNPTVRVSHAFFYAISARKLFWRGGVAARPAGQKQEWREWIEILGDFAPMPTLSAGVGQMFVAGYGYHTLPAGGTWYVQTLGITIDRGITTGTAAFLAGGTQVGNPGTGWVLAQCLYA